MNNLGDPLSRATWAISLPLIFAELNEIIVHVIDTAFLGRVGTTELGALALADTILEIWFVVALGLSEGMQIVIARRVGEEHDRRVGTTFNQGLLLVVILSVALTALLKLAAPTVAGLVTTSDEVAAAVNDFLQIAAFGLPLYGASFAFSAFYIGIGRTRVLIGATGLLALANLVLGYGLILGHLGLPRLGLEGAAWASLGAELVAALFLLTYTIRRAGVSRYGLFRFGPFDRKVVGSLVTLSGPVAMEALVEAFQWLLFFAIVGSIGPTALAVSNLVFSCLLILLIPGEAFAESVVSLVGKTLGRLSDGALGPVVRRALSPAYLVSAPLVLATLVLPEQVLSVFTSDQDLVAAAAGPLRVVGVAMIVVIPAALWSAAIAGAGDTVANGVIETVVAIVLIACAYSFGLEITYVWIAVPVAWGIGLILWYGWASLGFWKRVEV